VEVGLEAGNRRVIPKPMMHTAEGVSDERVVSRGDVRMGRAPRHA
jgi:hypothetical protein